MNISKWWVWLALALLPLNVLAADKPQDCAKAGTPQQIEGKVVKVDPAQEKITVQGSDGTTHVMQASKDTIKDYKPGDKIKAKLRCQ